MSSETLLSSVDRAAVAAVLADLPQSLIINTETGLDYQAVITRIVDTKSDEVYNLAPLSDKKSISVDQIRDTIAKTITYSTNRRIIIIDPASTMGPGAQNALLKSLEEPNNNLFFILITSNPQLLLPTIISRCQIINLHRTTPEQDDDLLRSLNVSPRSQQQILFLAAGRPLLIRQLAQQPELLEQGQSLVVASKTLLANNRYEKLKAINDYASDRSKAVQLVDTLATIIQFQLNQGRPTDTFDEIIDNLADIKSQIANNSNLKLSLLKLVN